MRNLRQGLPAPRALRHPRPHPHRRDALPVQRVLEKVPVAEGAGAAPGVSHGLEAVRVLHLQQRVQGRLQPEEAYEDGARDRRSEGGGRARDRRLRPERCHRHGCTMKDTIIKEKVWLYFVRPDINDQSFKCLTKCFGATGAL